ncbi:MAG: hypothetical protein M4579_003641 [Chaenotheca gracillima]|nr:MAG: hypothetical protein M4579_003641 [Chaenotheca gracillima]
MHQPDGAEDASHNISPTSTAARPAAAAGGGSGSSGVSGSGTAKLQLPVSCEPPGPSNPPRQLVWIVFGATGHMGRSLIRKALTQGDLVTAVGRSFESSLESMQDWHERCLGLLCDVRIRDTVGDVIRKTIERWGRIDVIANCSGYGVIGACEDQDDHEIRNQFETNFMGTLNIIQLSLPYFREQSGGRYLIFSSTSGALGVPGLGPYCATKYAVEGLIESMLYEIDAFGIKATLVEPGLARRDEPDNLTNPLPAWGHFFVKPVSEPYAHPTAPAGHAKRMVTWLGDKQPTSAVKCAELVWQLGHCSYPPLRLLLGSYAVESIRDRLRSIIEEVRILITVVVVLPQIEDWKHLSFPVVGGEDGGGGGGTGSGDGGPGSASGGGRGAAGEDNEGDEAGQMGDRDDEEEGEKTKSMSTTGRQLAPKGASIDGVGAAAPSGGV